MFDPDFFDAAFFQTQLEPTVPYRRPRLMIRMDGSAMGYRRRRRKRRR